MYQILKEAFSQKPTTLCWILTSTHKHHKVLTPYASHKRLPEKSCPDCLRILIMSWLFKDPVKIMKEIMIWLFKDLIVIVAWLNFDHAQSNSKKWPKKTKFPQMRFFLKKQLVKFSCTFWSLLLCKIVKQSWQQIQSYENVPFSCPKWPICP